MKHSNVCSGVYDCHLWKFVAHRLFRPKNATDTTDSARVIMSTVTLTAAPCRARLSSALSKKQIQRAIIVYMSR
eukprot:scaffold90766_cov17-Prasinocladus_malaysianus.AAC.1